MFTYSWDNAFGLVVFLFSGTTNTDADFERYLEAIADVDRRGQSIENGYIIAVVVAESENPVPSSAWRKKIAEATRRLDSKPIVAFVMPSKALRGVVTAINWIRPPPYSFSVHETFDEAVQWAETRSGRPLKLLQTLLHECYEKARPSNVTLGS